MTGSFLHVIASARDFARPMGEGEQSVAYLSGPPRRHRLPRGTRLLPSSLTDLATIGRHKAAVMRTITVIFVLVLITIAGEIYSHAALTSGEISSTAAPDSAAAAVVHGLKRG